MDKKVLPKIAICVFIIICIVVVWNLATKGYFRFGNDWMDTPEEALADYADRGMSDRKPILTPTTYIKKVYIEDIVEMTFISEDDTLVTVGFVTNEEGQYSVIGYTEEVWLDSPSMFLMNGDPDQIIMFSNQQEKTTVWGWCYSGYSFTVNGKIPTKETYTFDCQGKTWSIDYWQVEGIGEDEDVTIEYVD